MNVHDHTSMWTVHYFLCRLVKAVMVNIEIDISHVFTINEHMCLSNHTHWIKIKWIKIWTFNKFVSSEFSSNFNHIYNGKFINFFFHLTWKNTTCNNSFRIYFQSTAIDLPGFALPDPLKNIDDYNQKFKSGKSKGGFLAMGLSFAITKGITKRGYKIPTPVQRKTIPLILEGRNVVAMAKTGKKKI